MRQSVTMKAAAILLLVAGLANGAQGDQASEGRLKSLSLEQLGNIEVTTASKEPVKVTKTPAAIYVITEEDIRRSGATSIPEVLRLAPGVEVARIDAVKWSVGIRGFGSRLSRSVLVVIDGRNVYSPLFAGVYWEVQDTLLEDVERIEIIRGPGATIWGPNAVNGVINIITKSAKDTHGGLVSTGAGNEQRFLNFRYGGGNAKNFNYRAYGKAFTRGPEFHLDHKQFDDWQMGQGGFRMAWDPNSRDAVTFQGDLYKGAIGESTSVSPDLTTPPSVVQTDGQISGGNLLGRWRRDLGELGAPFLETSPPPTQSIIPLSLGNGLYGSTSGYEIAPDWRPVTWWRLDGSYSYLHLDLNKRPDSRDTSSALSTEGSNPHHKVVVRSWFSLPGGLEFSQTHRYVSVLPAQMVASYHSVDARLSWRPREQPLEFSVVGENLLQPHHPEFGGDPGTLVGIKRSVYAAITWRSGKR
jgi:outer membrane receptor protein involved in Fe transport